MASNTNKDIVIYSVILKVPCGGCFAGHLGDTSLWMKRIYEHKNDMLIYKT